ncbi:MAG: DUF262 domain-containing protein [Deltaproteobacteria bacterium]
MIGTDVRRCPSMSTDFRMVVNTPVFSSSNKVVAIAHRTTGGERRMIITIKGPQNVGQVKKQFECRNLFLSPEEYQRENAWDFDQKQLLIDTIFRGMDIPKLYFWKIDQETLKNGYPDGETKNLYKQILERKRNDNDELDPYVFEVVDGQQRIRTILEFMNIKPLDNKVYRGTWHDSFPTLAETPMAKGKSYEQLNAEQQIKFDESSLTIMILEKASIEEVRDMFLRLQNGTPLNAQQKRDAMGSYIGKLARELATTSFFATSVYFDNTSSDHHRVASQMIHLEKKEKIISCTSKQLDKLYKEHTNVQVEPSVASKAKKVLAVLGKIFPTKNPRLNRSYALSLYWVFSRILETYNITETDYVKIQENFEKLDDARLIAMYRDFSDTDDDIFSSLTQSMSRGTDGSDGISSRHDILSQFLFERVSLNPHPTLDPVRNFTHEEKLIIYRRSGGCCQLEHNSKICGRPLEFDDAAVDHIIPHSKRGKTELANGRIAYRACNIARGNHDDFNPVTMCHLIPTS